MQIGPEQRLIPQPKWLKEQLKDDTRTHDTAEGLILGSLDGPWGLWNFCELELKLLVYKNFSGRYIHKFHQNLKKFPQS